MIRETLKANTGIIFHEDKLLTLGLLSPSSPAEAAEAEGHTGAEASNSPQTNGYTATHVSTEKERKNDAKDACLAIHDELSKKPWWWLLEFVSLTNAWQDNDGWWHKRWRYGNLFAPLS